MSIACHEGPGDDGDMGLPRLALVTSIDRDKAAESKAHAAVA